MVVLVFGGLWFTRANASKKQAALLAEQDALRVAENDDEAGERHLEVLTQELGS